MILSLVMMGSLGIASRLHAHMLFDSGLCLISRKRIIHVRIIDMVFFFAPCNLFIVLFVYACPHLHASAVSLRLGTFLFRLFRVF